MDQEFAVRLVFEDLLDEEYAIWDCVEEGEGPGHKRNRGWYQIWENGGQFWKIEYYTSYDEGIDEDSVSFRQVEKKEKIVVFYD